MKRLSVPLGFVVGFVLVVFGLRVLVENHAFAAVTGDPQGRGAFGAVAVATTATAVPTSPLGTRNAFALFNNGPDTIYCGWASTVTAATGFPVTPGGTLSVDVTYDKMISGPKMYCITAVLQVSPAHTRYIEVK